MNIVGRWERHLAAAACAVCLASPAGAVTLLDTGTPDGGWFGYWGYDVFVGQSVAISFTPDQDYKLDDVSLWLMSNDFEAPGRTLTVSIQTDVAGSGTPSAPSGSVLESWDHATSAVGWAPVLETLDSILHPVLAAGTTYWLVAESSEPAFVDPVWVVAGDGNPYYIGNIDFASGPAWQVGEGYAAPGAIITAMPVPEPAIWALGLLGAPMVWRTARRRRAQDAVAA